MLSDTIAMTPLSENKHRWTDTEKLALLISVINDANPNPNWTNLTLPRGRTIKAAQHVFRQLKIEAAAHPMADRAEISATKKRGRKSASANEGDTTATTKKHGRGRKLTNADGTASAGPNEDDEEEMPKKKVKVEPKDEDGEDGMDGENEGFWDGVGA